MAHQLQTMYLCFLLYRANKNLSPHLFNTKDDTWHVSKLSYLKGKYNYPYTCQGVKTTRLSIRTGAEPREMVA